MSVTPTILQKHYLFTRVFKVPASIYAPLSITVPIGKKFELYCVILKDNLPVTDANINASLYSKDGLIETVTGQHITNGIYYFPFTDEKTDYGMILVEGVNYDVKAYVHLTRTGIGPEIILVRKILTNNWEIKDNQLIIYDDDGVTPLLKFNLYDKLGQPTEMNVYKRERVE